MPFAPFGHLVLYEFGGPCVPVIVLRIETRDCAGFQKRKPNMGITASDCELRGLLSL